MGAICKSSIKAKAIRVVRLDECGNPVAGPTGLAVSEGFVKVTLEPQVQEGQEFYVPNADGSPCINDKDKPRLKRYGVGIDFCAIDPDVIELMTGNRLIQRAGVGVTSDVGIGIGEDDVPDGGFAMELWTRVAGGNCGSGNDRWFHWVTPWVRNAMLGSFSFENGPLTVSIKADTQANANYGQGPFDLWTPGVRDTEHLDWQLTEVAPPTGACGYQELVLS